MLQSLLVSAGLTLAAGILIILMAYMDELCLYIKHGRRKEMPPGFELMFNGDRYKWVRNPPESGHPNMGSKQRYKRMAMLYAWGQYDKDEEYKKGLNWTRVM